MKAQRLLDAAGRRETPDRRQALLAEVSLAQGLIGDTSGLHAPAALVEDLVRAPLDGWKPAQWRGWLAQACFTLRDHHPALIEAVRAALLPWLLESGSGRGSGG